MRDLGDGTSNHGHQPRRHDGHLEPTTPHLTDAAAREVMQLEHLERTVTVAGVAVARFVDGLWNELVQKGYLRTSSDKAVEYAELLLEALDRAADGSPSITKAREVLRDLSKIVAHGPALARENMTAWVESTERHQREAGLSPQLLSRALIAQLEAYNNWVRARTLAETSATSKGTEARLAETIVYHHLADFTASLGARVLDYDVSKRSRRVSELLAVALEQGVSGLKKLWLQSVIRQISSERAEEPDVPNTEKANPIAAAFAEFWEDDAVDVRVEFTAKDQILTGKIVVAVDPTLAPILEGLLATGEIKEFSSMRRALELANAPTPSDPVVSTTLGVGARCEVTIPFAVPFLSKGKRRREGKDPQLDEICAVARRFDSAIPGFVQIGTSAHGAPVIVAGELLLRKDVGYHTRRALAFANSSTGIKNIIIYQMDDHELPFAAINVENADVALTADKGYHRACVEMIREGRIEEVIDAYTYNFNVLVRMPLHDIDDEEVSSAIRYLIEATQSKVELDVGAFESFGPNAMYQFVSLLKLGMQNFESKSGLPLGKFSLQVDEAGRVENGVLAIQFRIYPEGSATQLEGVFRRENGSNRLVLLKNGRYDKASGALEYLIDSTQNSIEVDAGTFESYGPSAMHEFVTLLTQGTENFEKQSGLPLGKFRLQIDPIDRVLEGVRSIQFRIYPEGTKTPLAGIFLREGEKNRFWLLRIGEYIAVPIGTAMRLYTIAYGDLEHDDALKDPEYIMEHHEAMQFNHSAAFHYWLHGLSMEPKMTLPQFRVALARWLFDNDHMVAEMEGSTYIHLTKDITPYIGNDADPGDEAGDEGEEWKLGGVDPDSDGPNFDELPRPDVQ